MAELGNAIVNKIYEAEVYEVVAKRATLTSNGQERENWIKAKYIAKAFIRGSVLFQSDDGAIGTGRWTVRRLRRRNRTGSLKKQSAKEQQDKEAKDVDTSASRRVNAEEILFGASLGKHHVASIELDSDQESTDGEKEVEDSSDHHSLAEESLLQRLTPDHLLYRAARVHNLPVMSQALALGADRDWHTEDSASSVIHQSILSGSVMACEFLLLNGAKIDVIDAKGNTPLHLAAQQGSTGQVCLLLKHRANHHLLNVDGHKALDIAVQNSDADIVTLLRLAELNEEIRESDLSGGGDDTFNDVVQEFSHMVYTHPERLHKK